MSEIDFDLGFWLRMVLRAVVLLWFYKLGRVAALSGRVYSSTSNLHGSNQGFFFWIGTHSPQVHNDYGFFFWTGIIVAAMIFMVIELWVHLVASRKRRRDDEE